MPFRCKCGRTFEKLDSFSSHTSGCAPFHHRRISSADANGTTSSLVKPPKIQTTFDTLFPSLSSGRVLSSPQSSASIWDTKFMMPTALSIQNTFETVRRRSMSYSEASPP
ncbi:hypothetical protein K501DRAFT_283661 [Backusella circina FSU 941]|nr:hypothetical protein K501DRAFT_289668 [Backusella circina FSU 941]KAI8886774.1 hypothetical protein K501DRAFT_283661 [Backusella circina FSU 941]